MGLAAEWQVLSERPVFGLSEDEVGALLDGLFAHAARVSARVLEVLRAADARGLAAAAGATGMGAWVRDRERVSAHTAPRLVKLSAAVGGSVVGASVVGEALSAGRVNVEQAQVIVDAVAQVPAAHRVAGERLLVEQAAVFGPRELARLGERLVEVLDPDGVDAVQARRLERAEQRAFAGRQFNLTDVGGGRTRVTGWLDREGAAVVRAAVDALGSPRVGAPADGVEARTVSQRRADAVVDVCRLALATGRLPDHGGERPQLVVTVDWQWLRDRVGAGRLDDGSVLSLAWRATGVDDRRDGDCHVAPAAARIRRTRSGGGPPLCR